jgi:quinol monooxygenase YgiN
VRRTTGYLFIKETQDGKDCGSPIFQRHEDNRLSHHICHSVRAAAVMNVVLDDSELAQQRSHVVRLAKLQVNPAQLDSYKTALKEEIEISVRDEPGVLSLEAVSVKDKPNEFTILEVYANPAAYTSHLESPHFKKYKAVTQGMVTSLELIECNPLVLACKSSAKERL